MIITVIAAGYDEDDKDVIDDVPLPAETAVNEPAPAKKPAQAAPAADPRRPQRPASAIPRLDDDDDLSEIFKILDKK